MELQTKKSEGVLTVHVADRRLDAAVATAFKDAMRRVIGGGIDEVRLDLSDVEFMDSSGLGAVIAVLKGMPAGRRFELLHLTPNVARVFRLTRMDTIFTIDGVEPASARAGG